MEDHELISMLRDRIKRITDDANTFTFVKTTTPNALNNYDLNLGGGNFLVALGLFTCLGFLAKTYVLLTNQAVLNSSKDINETDAVWKLIKNLPNHIDLGLPKEKEFVEAHWKQVRNSLAHMAVSKLTVFSFGVEKGLSYKEVIDSLKNTDKKPFFKFGVRNEVLSIYLHRILDWMNDEIQSGKYDVETIEKVREWYEDSLYTTEEDLEIRMKYWHLLED